MDQVARLEERYRKLQFRKRDDAAEMRAQLAQSGDPVDDSTARWPAGREWVDMGVIELTVQDTVRETGGDVLVMDPTRVTPGIEPSADPILHVRRAAYAVSVAQRSGAAGRD